MKGLLLDTHVWIWLLEGAADLSRKHQKIVNEAAQNSYVGIAAISTWEVGMLVMKGRIRLEKPVLSWIKDALALPGIELLPLTPEIAVESTQLPDGFHGDPADRLIIATARLHQLTLLTHDRKIIDYAKKDYISAIAT
jgi:PIN domain nuclease of toxin-antitoxin system